MSEDDFNEDHLDNFADCKLATALLIKVISIIYILWYNIDNILYLTNNWVALGNGYDLRPSIIIIILCVTYGALYLLHTRTLEYILNIKQKQIVSVLTFRIILALTSLVCYSNYVILYVFIKLNGDMYDITNDIYDIQYPYIYSAFIMLSLGIILILLSFFGIINYYGNINQPDKCERRFIICVLLMLLCGCLMITCIDEIQTLSKNINILNDISFYVYMRLLFGIIIYVCLIYLSFSKKQRNHFEPMPVTLWFLFWSIIAFVTANLIITIFVYKNINLYNTYPELWFRYFYSGLISFIIGTLSCIILYVKVYLPKSQHDEETPLIA